MSRSELPPLVDPGRRTPDTPDPDKYSACVHCGFCLEVCPTYQEWSDENHSPRGRVYLIKQSDQGLMAMDEAVSGPVWSCLDCRACETVCPSGVQVGALIEEARGQDRGQHLGARGERVLHLFLRGVFPYPSRVVALGNLLRLYQWSGLQRFSNKARLLRFLPDHLREMEAVLPQIRSRPALKTLPARTQAKHPAKGVAALFTGCVMDVLFAPVNIATAKLLGRSGLDVVVPKEQRCCGALHVHAGDRSQARELARHNIDAFAASGADYVVVNAAGCGAAMKEYPELFAGDDPYAHKAERFSRRVRDITEILVEVGLEPPIERSAQTVTYHDACHLCHAQGIREQPRALLRSIPGLIVVEMPDSDRCCGSAGIYNLTNPDMANRLLERKMDDVPDGVTTIVTGNPGCMLQLELGAARRGQPLTILHTAEFLEQAYERGETVHAGKQGRTGAARDRGSGGGHQ